jgi:YHS domain-containing protein
MIRSLLISFVLLMVYYALKAVFRSAVRGEYTDERRSSKVLPGEEMVQDPMCRTYVVKSRAVTRHINGKLCLFCSETCAKQYIDKNRS